MTYEDGVREGKRLAYVDAAEIADVVADEADATAFRYKDDAAVALWRARERAAKEVARRVRLAMDQESAPAL